MVPRQVAGYKGNSSRGSTIFIAKNGMHAVYRADRRSANTVDDFSHDFDPDIGFGDELLSQAVYNLPSDSVEWNKQYSCGQAC